MMTILGSSMPCRSCGLISPTIVGVRVKLFLSNATNSRSWEEEEIEKESVVPSKVVLISLGACASVISNTTVDEDASSSWKRDTFPMASVLRNAVSESYNRKARLI